MNSRERMLAAINHEPYDRVPTDIWSTGEVWQKLQAHFGAGADILRAAAYRRHGRLWARNIVGRRCRRCRKMSRSISGACASGGRITAPAPIMSSAPGRWRGRHHRRPGAVCVAERGLVRLLGDARASAGGRERRW